MSFFEQKGATYTGEDVTVDGLIITANGPKAAEEFGKKFARMSSK
jgi:putative intracellular protease/amidase